MRIVILDVSPVAWGERDVMRKANDQKRQNKRSVGPTILPEVLDCVQAFVSQCPPPCVILGVAASHTKLLHEGPLTELRRNLTTGVAALVAQAADDADPRAAMAAALSQALCMLRTHSSNQQQQDETRPAQGIFALTQGPNKKPKTTTTSDRILLLQASPDRPRDYNAFMNCAFASPAPIDACLLGGTSPLLEQACDWTGGAFLAPSGAAQVGGALTEVLWSVFLEPSLNAANNNNNKVDFRARAGDRAVDMALVCNQCLSIFAQKPTGKECPTCGATIVEQTKGIVA